LEEAAEILAEVVAQDPRCGASHRYLAHYYKALGEDWLSQWHLREARQLGE